MTKATASKARIRLLRQLADKGLPGYSWSDLFATRGASSEPAPMFAAVKLSVLRAFVAGVTATSPDGKQRGPALNGREPFNTRLAPDVVEALRVEAKKAHGTRRRANLVIERLAREHLGRTT